MALGNDKRLFSLYLKFYDRTWTRSQYKSIARWLRVCARETHKNLDLDSLSRAFAEVSLYGCSEYSLQC